jgi:hypothetical protein
VAVTAHDYPAEQGSQELDEISCSRAGRFSQRELDRVLNALLEVVSPSGSPAGSGPAPKEK